MLAAPLIVNLDVRSMDAETSAILLNSEIIAINQDALGVQGSTIYRNGDLQVLSKKLSGGDVAICVFNRSEKPLSFNVDIRNHLDLWAPFKVNDIYSKKDLGKITQLKGELQGHDCRVFRFSRLK
jgi:alpha-galactosidase